MKLNKTALALTLSALACAAPAQAQIGVYVQPQINPRPTVSPYLSILRNNPAATYYGLVRPQQQAAQQLMQLQQEAALFQQPGLMYPLEQQQLNLTGVTTGHAVSFQNYSHYYGGRGSTGGVAGSTGNPIGRANPAAVPI